VSERDVVIRLMLITGLALLLVQALLSIATHAGWVTT